MGEIYDMGKIGLTESSPLLCYEFIINILVPTMNKAIHSDSESSGQ